MPHEIEPCLEFCRLASIQILTGGPPDVVRRANNARRAPLCVFPRYGSESVCDGGRAGGDRIGGRRGVVACAAVPGTRAACLWTGGRASGVDARCAGTSNGLLQLSGVGTHYSCPDGAA